MTDWRKSIAKRLRVARGSRNQRDFAERIGTTQQTISQYEQGRIAGSWLFLARLHDRDGVDLNELLTLDE